MEQKTFEEIKEELLLRAKKAGACQIGYAMGLRSQCKADILKAITDNWSWVLRTARIVDAEYLEDNFDEEDLAEAGIYTQKYHEVTTTSFAYDSATVKAYDSATVKAYLVKIMCTLLTPCRIFSISCLASSEIKC